MHENERIIREAYRLAEEKDIEGWIACFTEDGTFTQENIPVTHRGRDVGVPVAERARAFPDMHRELHRFYIDGNVVIVQLSLQGTNTGPLATPNGEIPPTGRRMDAPCCDVFELENGKIKRFDCYAEGSVISKQLGLS